jgi:hypothetical protein
MSVRIVGHPETSIPISGGRQEIQTGPLTVGPGRTALVVDIEKAVPRADPAKRVLDAIAGLTTGPSEVFVVEMRTERSMVDPWSSGD